MDVLLKLCKVTCLPIFRDITKKDKFLGTQHHTHIDDSAANAESKDYDHKPLEFLKNHPKNPANDYFLPPVFNTNEENEEDEEDDGTYSDYYDTKETNYKDSPDLATVRSNVHQDLLPLDDKIPLHTTKDNLPIFLLEPENTYVVKNKPATLKCRAANALEVSIIIIFLSIFDGGIQETLEFVITRKV